MASQGPLYAGTAANFNDGGTTAWSNPTNAQGDTTSTATTVALATNGDTSQRLRASNFGFTIPAGATINGITVEIERNSANNSRHYVNSIRLLIAGTESGSDLSAGAAIQTTKEFQTWGSASNLWGLTPTRDQVNATGFGVSFKINRNSAQSTTTSVYRVRITVEYTSVSVPTVTSAAATSVTYKSAVGNGEVTATGGATVTARGIVYDTSSKTQPGNVAPGSSGYASVQTESGSFGTGTFNRTLPSLSASTTYYYRAYAQNSAGYAYSSTEQTFNTPATPGVLLAASANISAAAADTTTARLTAPTGKSSGTDFSAGRASDDTNPLPAIDLASGKYTEVVFAFKATRAGTFQFRVTDNGTALSNYNNTIDLTASTGFTMTADQGSYTLTGQAMIPKAARQLTAAQGSYTLTGIAATLTKGRVLLAEFGSYALTGQATGTLAARLMAAAQGAYTLTGNATGTLAGRLLTAAQGAYTLTGQAANTLYGRALLAAQGAYSLTGNALGMVAARMMAAAQGAYTLTGIEAIIQKGFTMLAGQGSYTLTGNDAGTTVTRLLTAAQGSYTLTGIDATIQKGFTMAAAAGSYTLTGNDAALLVARLLTAAQGGYTVSGQDAGTVAARLMAAGQGNYTLTGPDAAALVGRLLTSAQGSYTLTGFDATLTYDGAGGAFTLTADAGTYTLTGQAAPLTVSRLMAAAQGTYVLTGNDAALKAARAIAANNGAYTLTGPAVGILAAHLLTAAQGAYTLTGQAAYRGFRLTAGQGAYTLTGQDAVTLLARLLTAEQGGYTLTGIAAALRFQGLFDPIATGLLMGDPSTMTIKIKGQAVGVPSLKARRTR